MFKSTTPLYMKIGATNKLLLVATISCCILACAKLSSACDLFLQCKDIERIVVSRGTDYLPNGQGKKVFVVCVDISSSMVNLKEFMEKCNSESVVVKIKNFSVDVPKRNFPGGQSFCIVRMRPQDALDIARNICQEKVKSFLSE